MRLFTIILFFTPALLIAQEPVQTLRGKVADAHTLQPLAGATLTLHPGGWGAVSDSTGRFRLVHIPVGRYDLSVRFMGYGTLILPELLLESGKELTLDLYLLPQSTVMDEVVVRAPRRGAPLIGSGNEQVFTTEETRRFPAAFYDPARVAVSMAGVANVHDGANGIAVRGNSPNGIAWRLEGVDIVNPNHLPNAGTLSDQASIYGGGVNIMSAQLLADTRLLSGAFPAEYGNALSGVLDMRLRSGNNQRREFTAQAGLIGLDLAAEGPIFSRSEASYLVNYRYSTVGLLSALGIPLGDEDVRFQDLSFHLNFPGRGRSAWTVFGLGGQSINRFEAKRDSAEWQFQKDRSDIAFRARMGALGLTHTQSLGKRGEWHSVLAVSALGSTRERAQLDDALVPQLEERNWLRQSKLSAHSYLRLQVGAGHQFRAGIQYAQQLFNVLAIHQQGADTLALGKGSGGLWQPYLSYSVRLSSKLQGQAGIHGMYFSLNGSSSIEPRATLIWMPSAQQRFHLAYGLHSQLQVPQLYFAHSGGTGNRYLGFTRAHHLTLGWYRQWGASSHIQAQVYYQYLFRVPVDSEATSTFSALNLLEDFAPSQLVNLGTGRNYGLELTARRYVARNWWFVGNTAWYRSLYTPADGVERSSRFDGRYALNLAGGKEWRKAKQEDGISRLWGVSARVLWNGGFRYTPVDAEASQASGFTVYRTQEAFSLRLPDYFRPDLRVYLQRSRKNRSSILSLDIQNLINRPNLAFYVFDMQQGVVTPRYQLGIIPVLGYRIEFF